MRRLVSMVVVCGLALAAAARPARSQTAVPPDQIEEDWKVVIAVPDPAGGGPQIATMMSPVGDDSEPCVVFDLNYRTAPSFAPGGMQVQVWSGDQLLSVNSKGTAQCSTAGETITWTQRMRLSSGTINFALDSGQSATWGKFGQGQQLNLSGSWATSLTSLSQYSPATSVTNSGVGWERNRVTSMTLLRVRYYAGGKLLSTDATARSVDLSQ